MKPKQQDRSAARERAISEAKLQQSLKPFEISIEEAFELGYDLGWDAHADNSAKRQSKTARYSVWRGATANPADVNN